MARKPTVMSRTWLRSRFENGDTPDQNEWYVIFDSFVHKVEDSHLFNFADIIDDDVTALDKTWSSEKIADEIAANASPILKIKQTFTNASIVDIYHNFNTDYITYKAFYPGPDGYEEFIPSRFILINSNHARMEMNPPTSGFVILMGTEIA